MSRGLSNAVKTLLDALNIPALILTFEFETQALLLTNYPRSITIGTKTYRGAKANSSAEFVIKASGLSENLNFEAPTAVIEIASLSAWAQALFFEDAFREDTCVVSILYSDGSSFLESGWTTRFKCDAEEIDANKVRIRLGSLDAAQGTEIPRRTSQSDGCQWEFQMSDEDAGCTFRWVQGVHSAALQVCDRTYDGPLGCVAHHPDVTHPRTLERVARPKPYGAYLGKIDHKLVRSG